jgi:hypothetical protein
MSAPRALRVVRVALIVCDYWTKKLFEYNGDYLNMYRRWLNASLPKHSGHKLVMDAYDAQRKELPEEGLIDNYDAVLISGAGKLIFSRLKFPVGNSSTTIFRF